MVGSLRLLIIGGTRFMGRHLMELASAAGHDVTVFHRGSTRCPLPDGVTELFGDRTGEVSALRGGGWDAVVDMCAYLPQDVETTVHALGAAPQRYLLVSSLSAYGAPLARGLTEADPVSAPPAERVETMTDDMYGALKVACERACTSLLGERVLVLRPGLLVGPHDPTGRFTYWPARAAGGGEMLVPAPADAPIQVADARDLAAFALNRLEALDSGVYNCAGPVLTRADLVEACTSAVGADAARPVWVEESFLADHGIAEWTDLPLWIAHDNPLGGMLCFDTSRARNAGLASRSLAVTAADTLAWTRQDHPLPTPVVAVATSPLAREREAAVLAAWRARG